MGRDLQKIAIIGAGCHFPQASNINEYWSIIKNGLDAITEIPQDRWKHEQYCNDLTDNSGKSTPRWGGFIEKPQWFDASFFHIARNEAEHIDPQQRLLLETSWQAIEHAGIPLEKIKGSRTGVFVGISTFDYSRLTPFEPKSVTPYSGSGNALSIAANRLSYFYDLRGPSMAIDTACSSSLVGVDLAINNLRQGNCDMAIAGGVSLLLSPELTLAFSAANMLAQDGRCKTFDQSADGYVRGEGCGIVVLKRLEEAQAAGDHILAVIESSAINQDGRSNGITAPNGPAQETLIQEALKKAELKANQIGYLEAHGTGTSLGDPIEVEALNNVFKKSGQTHTQHTQVPQTSCAIGSVKTNIGHLEAAAGIAGLIKTALVLKHATIPPLVHFKTLNKTIAQIQPIFDFPIKARRWKSDSPRYAGVSSFGFGGTNAHIIMSEAPSGKLTSEVYSQTQKPLATKPIAPPANPTQIVGESHILCISATNALALRNQLPVWIKFLSQYSDEQLPIICANSQRHKSELACRLAFPASSIEQLVNKINQHLSHDDYEDTNKHKPQSQNTPLIFVFSGQGAWYQQAGYELYQCSSIFRSSMTHCSEILQQYSGESLLEEWLSENPVEAPSSTAEAHANKSQPSQPLLVALQISLTHLWQHWGLQADLVIGHSLGEISAAYACGTLTLEQALQLSWFREQAMESAKDTGRMLAVNLAVEQLNEFISQDSSLQISAYNAEDNQTVSGPEKAILALQKWLLDAGHDCRLVQTTTPFHSSKMEAAKLALNTTLPSIISNTPRIKMISTMTGQYIDGGTLGNHYWENQLREPVNFYEALKTLKNDYSDAVNIIEVSAQPVLRHSILQTLPQARVHSTLRRGRKEHEYILETLAQCWTEGQKINWPAVSNHQDKGIKLPFYIFNKQYYWLKKTVLDAAPDNLSQKPSEIRSTSHAINASATVPTSAPTPISIPTTAVPTTAVPTTTAPTPAPTRKEFSTMTATTGSVSEKRTKSSIIQDLTRFLAKTLNESPENIDIYQPFVELGADSLSLAESGRRIELNYDVKIPLRRFFEDLRNVDQLASYLSEHAIKPSQNNQQPITANSSQHPALYPAQQATQHTTGYLSGHQTVALTQQTGQNFQDTFRLQIESLQQVINRQLDMMAGTSVNLPASEYNSTTNELVGTAGTEKMSVTSVETTPANSDISNTSSAKSTSPTTNGFGPYRPPQINQATQSLNSQQMHSAHTTDEASNTLQTLIAKYTAKTPGSKAYAAKWRARLADSRASAGFRPSTKSMLYPIVGERAENSRLWDIDGNEYIDISMDFGVNLLGHQNPVIQQALAQQLEKGTALAMRSRLVGEAAELLCDLTHSERAVFCQSGSEAVMTSLRLARLYTQRQTVVVFSHSYHGHSDGVLAADNGRGVEPVTSGIPAGAVSDIVVLEYGAPESLEYIRHHGQHLAAVLVEPVQSRNPNLQPKAFLEDLRKITHEQDIVLIFDEMITGFRVHPGGAQAYFGVQADIASYGKVLGGGQQIAAIAGKAHLLAGIDGGTWQFDDDSYPSAPTTFFAGTFNANPLAIASCHAILSHLKNEGGKLQITLNKNTEYLASSLNLWFEENQIPIEIAHFGSLFRFVFKRNLDILFFLLIHKGLFIWEGRNCFLSTAHTIEDIEKIILTVKEAIFELQSSGYLPNNKKLSQYNEKHFPTSNAQKQLFLAQQMEDKAGSAYHECIHLKITGNINPEHFQHALSGIVQRHEALRTVFSIDGNTQTVLEDLNVDLDNIPLEHCTSPTTLALWSKDYAENLFDLHQGPLLRVALSERIHEEYHYLVLSIHHLITDGWSMSILLRELFSNYTRAIDNQLNVNPAINQFRHHCQYLARLEDDENEREHAQYWQTSLQDYQPLNWNQHHYNDHAFWQGGQSSTDLSADIRNTLESLAREQGATLFMVLLAAWQGFLYRITEQQDIIIGCPVLGRDDARSMEIVGYLTHLLPVRLQLDTQSSFVDLINHCRTQSLDAFDHQRYPFSETLKHWKTQQKDNTPLVDLTFNLDSAPEQLPDSQVSVSILPHQTNTTKFALSLNVIDFKGTLKLQFTYRKSLFDQAIGNTLPEQFSHWLNSLCTSPSQAISQHALYSCQSHSTSITEQHDIQEDTTSEEASKVATDTIVSRISEMAIQFPSHIAITEAYLDPANIELDVHQENTSDKNQITYQQLNEQSTQVAKYLLSQGIAPGDTVAIALARSSDLLIFQLAIMKCRANYLTLDVQWPSARIEKVISETHAHLVLCDENFSESTVPCQIIQLKDAREQWQSFDSDDTFTVQNDDTACVLYTSGTTGTPKGIPLSHRNIISFFYALADMQHEPKDQEHINLFHSSPSFDASIYQSWIPLMQGGQSIIAKDPHITAEVFEQAQQQFACNTVFISTSLFHRIVSLKAEALQNYVCISVGGEALSVRGTNAFLQAMNEKCNSTPPYLYNVYGPTECAIWCVVNHIDTTFAEEQTTIPIGNPLSNTRYYILDKNKQEVLPGLTGELHITGTNVSQGYINQRNSVADGGKQEASPFTENPFAPDSKQKLYKTGDLVRRNMKGELEFIGREDKQIKWHGYRIDLNEISSCLQENILVQRACVHTVEKNNDKLLVASVILAQKNISASEIESIKINLQKTLPPYMVPQHFQILEEFPLTKNGKLDYTALPLPPSLQDAQAYSSENIGAEDSDTENLGTMVPASTATQKALHGIWKKRLSVKDFGIKDNFFAIGGHSLTAMEIVADINKSFENNISMKDFFLANNIEQLSLKIEAEQKNSCGGSNADSSSASSSMKVVSRSARRRTLTT